MALGSGCVLECIATVQDVCVLGWIACYWKQCNSCCSYTESDIKIKLSLHTFLPSNLMGSTTNCMILLC